MEKTIRGKILSPQELGYLAGFLDADGCINIYRISSEKHLNKRKNPRYELSVTMYNCNKQVLEWMQDLFGGYLQTRSRPILTWKQGYAWKLSSNKAMKFLKLIVPYMRIKKKRAEISIEFQTKKSNKKRRFRPLTQEEIDYYESCWKELKRLNQKGDKITRRD